MFFRFLNIAGTMVMTIFAYETTIKRNTSMSNTRLVYHIVIRPKNSIGVIPMEHERELYAYILGIIRQKRGNAIRIGGMPDHIHMLVSLPPTVCISDFVRIIKTSTNAYMKANSAHFPLFQEWSKEYFAVSCSPDDVEGIRQYIMSQKEHHKKIRFTDELQQLAKKFGIELYAPQSDKAPLQELKNNTIA